jgi:DNA-binding transcriptional LysR family regulator
VLTLGSNGAIKQAARAGLGIALQSRAAVELELKLGLLDTITPRGGLPERRWHVVRSAIGPVREDVEAFMAFCASPAAKHALAAG